MVGFALALAGGALEGWGEGQLQAIKQTREEKLRQLELDRAERSEIRRLEAEKLEGAAGRAVQREQIAATKEAAAASLKVQQELANRGYDIDERRITSGETLTREQIKAEEKNNLARLSSAEGIAAADRAAAAPVVTTKEGDTGTLESGIFKPTVDANGKPVNIITSDNENSADAKTIQYLINLGTPVEEAKRLVLENKNSDPAVLGASIFNNIMDVSRKNMGNPTPDQITDQVTAAIGHTRRAMREMGLNPNDWNPAGGSTTGEGETGETGEAPAPSSAAEPGSTSAETQAKPLPEGETVESMIAAAKDAVASGVSKAEARRTLQAYGIDPAKAGF